MSDDPASGDHDAGFRSGFESRLRLTVDSIMNPTSTKRRRSSSPGGSDPPARRSASPVVAPGRSPLSVSNTTVPRHPTASPSHPILPPPLPSSSHGQGPPPPPGSSSGGAGGRHPFPPFAGPSNWASQSSGWSSSSARPHNVRHSMDIRSPTPASPKDEDDMPHGLPGIIFTRESRAPRSMMACTRCRRQKMKCDGPTQVPCRGCRQAGQPCVFEARSRPKSISALPSRTPLYSGSMQGHPGRPGTPSAGPGFYPSGPQPAPPITSRPPPEYALRQAREPMPPPPQASMTVLTSVPYRPTSPPPPPQQQQPQHPPQPVAGPPVVLQPIGPPPTAPPYVSLPPPPTASSTASQQHDSRIRHLESSVHALGGVPATLNSLQMAIADMQRSLDTLASGSRSGAAGAGAGASGSRSSRSTGTRARAVHAEILDTVWENYRTRSWPLTPWLVGLRDAQGLPSLVVSLLGKRPLVDRGEVSRRECEDAAALITNEIGALIGQPTEWTREEIRSLGVYATWLNDTALAALTVGLARRQEHDRLLPRKTQDDWREWIYVFILDHMIHLADFSAPIASGSLANPWRDRLSTSVPGDPAVRDRDLKLLAWLEYAEMMRDIYDLQLAARTPAPSAAADVEDETMSVSDRGTERERDRDRDRDRPAAKTASIASTSAGDDSSSERRKIMEIWRKYMSRWDAWATGWSARGDPVLSIYHHYAVLYTSSPSFLASPTIWTELSQAHDGYTQLERTRDAAFALIQALCSPEIGRTLVYSFALYRPLLGLALHTVLCLCTSLPNSPLISLSHVTTVLRSTHDVILNARPLDIVVPTPSSRSSVPPVSVLAEMAEGGSSVIMAVAKRDLLGVEPGAMLWKRLLG